MKKKKLGGVKWQARLQPTFQQKQERRDFQRSSDEEISRRIKKENGKPSMKNNRVRKKRIEKAKRDNCEIGVKSNSCVKHVARNIQKGWTKRGMGKRPTKGREKSQPHLFGDKEKRKASNVRGKKGTENSEKGNQKRY